MFFIFFLVLDFRGKSKKPPNPDRRQELLFYKFLNLSLFGEDFPKDAVLMSKYRAEWIKAWVLERLSKSLKGKLNHRPSTHYFKRHRSDNPGTPCSPSQPSQWVSNSSSHEIKTAKAKERLAVFVTILFNLSSLLYLLRLSYNPKITTSPRSFLLTLKLFHSSFSSSCFPSPSPRSPRSR